MLCITFAVLVANSPALLHLVTTNPLVTTAGLAPNSGRVLPGGDVTDPNIGYTLQALGHRAALDWFHGHVPWWNPFEGIGAPLAGEMQSGAFFPLTLVLVAHEGVLILQVALELISGCSTYFLVRRLGVGRALATAAGIAFGLCGTFAWLGHAPIRPAAMVPLCVLGVERGLDAAVQGRRGGWRLLAVGIALLILAGFPETTFFGALFVVWWAILRAFGPGRTVWRSFVGRMALGGVIGVGLSAPLIVAFADYLPWADVGAHNGQFAHASLPVHGLSQLVLPYSLGPIFAFPTVSVPFNAISANWGSVGGFLTATVVAGALVGLVGAVVGGRQRLLRLGLGGWALLCLLRSYGFAPLVRLLAPVPLIRETAFFRYTDPTWELAVIVLAVLGLDDVARGRVRRAVLMGAVVVTGLISAAAATSAWRLLHSLTVGRPAPNAGPAPWTYVAGSLIFALVVLALLAAGGLIAGRFPTVATSAPAGSGVRRRAEGAGTRPTQVARFQRRRQRGRVVMASAICIESIVMLAFTYLSAPKPTDFQTRAVPFLQAHLGTYRFFTLGPIQPEYGSYFGIGQVNINDLPEPKAWIRFIKTDLDPNTLPEIFSGGIRTNSAGPTPSQELSSHLANYEAVGVRYVVEMASGSDVFHVPFPLPGTPEWPVGPRLVYRDSFAQVWQLPNPTPLFSLEAVRDSGTARLGQTSTTKDTVPAGCLLTAQGFDEATVDCPRPVVLVRRVQYMPGWSVSGADHPLAVDRDAAGPGGLFQTVTVPAGRSALHFSYLPPHATISIVIAALSLVVLVGPSVLPRRRRTRRNSPSRSESNGGSA